MKIAVQRSQSKQIKINFSLVIKSKAIYFIKSKLRVLNVNYKCCKCFLFTDKLFSQFWRKSAWIKKG